MASSLEKRWKLANERFNTSLFGIAKNGDLTIRNRGKSWSVPELAGAHGTPLEICFPDVVTQRVSTIIKAFKKNIRKEKYGAEFMYHYPMKANQRKEFVLAALAGGAHIETSSANELSLVREMIEKRQAKRTIHIHCNGPKTSEYLKLIWNMHAEGYLIVPIIEDAGELASLKKYPGNVGIRVDLDIKIKSHWDKKFNRFGFREEELRALGTIPNLSILSYHLSSQIEGVDSFTKPIQRAMHLYADLKKNNPGLTTLNIGGGAGVPYIKEPFYTTEELAATIVVAAKKAAAGLGIHPPNLMCEWGRHVAAPAQISVFKIIGAKSIARNSKILWYVIDGSFIANLPDTWSLHQRWHVIPANRLNEHSMRSAWLAGSSCDSDDEYIPVKKQTLVMPEILPNTELYVAVFDTGAYQNSLASHHCLLSHPARIAVHNGKISRIASKETFKEAGKSFGW